VPTCVVEHQVDLFALLGRYFLGHGVDEGLENLRVAMSHNQADQAAGVGFDRTNDIAPDMPAVIALRWAAA
jgi:hypothetical protein